MRRLGIRISNAMLFVLCCYAAAGLFNEVSHALLVPPDGPSGIALADAPTLTARSATRVLDINKRNVFGSAVQVTKAPPPKPAPEVATLTKLPLVLIGTAAFADDVESSRAAISSKGGKETQVLKVGDSLEDLKQPTVMVLAISAREVILDNRGNREILRLYEETGISAVRSADKPTRSPPPPRRSTQRTSSRSSRSSSRSPFKLVEDLKKLASQPAQAGGFAEILAQAPQILPKYDNGKMVGIELAEIASGSFYEEIGLKNGDVISMLNGVEINSPTASQEVIESLAELSVPEIFAIVNGRPFKVPAEKIAEFMENSGALPR